MLKERVTLDANTTTDFLENAKLYESRIFIKPFQFMTKIDVKEVNLHCDICEQLRPYQYRGSIGTGSGKQIKYLETGFSFFELTCVSCGKSKVHYWINQVVDKDTITLQKIGEFPKEKINKNRELEKFLSSEKDLYNKAKICLSHNYGIAAFAYYRRLVENNIEKLIKKIEEDAKGAGASSEILQAISQLHEKSPMSEKIKIAKHALPEQLRIKGENPLSQIYQSLSEGLHTLSEPECLDKARNIEICLTFIISELASREKNRTSYRTSFQNI